GDRPAGRGARDVRAPAHATQSARPAVGGPRVRGRRGVGQLPADVFARGPDHRRAAPQSPLDRRCMSRLVVVSNRVPLPSEGARAGGLAVALGSAMEDTGGLWFGWSGKRVRGQSGERHVQQEGNVTFVTIDLTWVDFEA